MAEEITSSGNAPANPILANYPQPLKHPAESSDSSVIDELSVEEYGRTYHLYKQGAYLLPNDAAEQNRLDIQHKTITTLLGGKLSLPPIEPRNVLDIATGTGIWAIEFAKQYPNSRVIGSDLSLIQPQGIVENCSFVRQDAEGDEWTYTHAFDYIHFRMLFTCFNDLTVILQKAYSHLEPGGWIEFQDHTPEILSSDGSSHGSALEQFGQAIVDGLARVGRDATRIKHLRKLLVAQGFVDVVEKVMPYPVGAWPEDRHYRDVGRWMAHNVALGLDGSIKMLLAAGLSWSEAQDLTTRVRGELKTNLVHAYLPFYVVYGRKP